MAIVNYINSPSFETASWQSVGGQVWTETHTLGTATMTRSTTGAKTQGAWGLTVGNSSAIVVTATLSGIVLPDTGTPKTWTFSFDVASITASDTGSTAAFFYNSGSGNVSLGSVSLTTAKRYSITFTQNPGITNFAFAINARIDGAGSSNTIRADGLRLCEGTSTTYIDGNTPGYAWSGTADESSTVNIYTGVFNHWPQPRTPSRSWVSFWESGTQTSGGMTVTNGAGGVTVSGSISRSSTTTYLDVGASSSNATDPLHLGGINSGTAYISASVSGVSGLLSNDQIKLIVQFFNAGKTSLSSVSVLLPRTGGRDGGAITVPAGAVYARVSFTIQTPSGFTAAAHAVSATLDFIRISPQASTAYLDGDTAGYTWRGTAGDSVTIDTTPIEAAGSLSAPGGIETFIQPYIEGAASVAITGGVEVFLDSIDANGQMTISGAAELWQYGPVIADASVHVGGSLVIAALIPIEMAGSVGVTGSVETALAIPFFAAPATFAISGTAEVTLPPDMVGQGNVVIMGALESAIAGQTGGDAQLVIAGQIEIATRIPAGAFGDIALFAVSETDPLRSITSGSNGGIQSGANDAEWSRVYAEFAAPQATKQWRRAAYATVGIQFANVAAGKWQEFTYAQAEVTASGGPTEYKPAASLRPLVYPDRLNVHPHAVGVLAEPGPSWGATPITSPIEEDVTGGLRVPVKTGQNMFIATNLDWLRPGAVYTASMWVKIGGTDLTDVAINTVRAASLESISDKMWVSDAEDDEDLGEGWRRIHCVFTAPDDGFARLIFDIQREDVVDDYFDLAGMLVEEGIEVRDYFWPLENSADIGYRDGYSDATGGIFYYKNRLTRTYILRQALKDQVSTGIGVLDPEFFLIPHVDV